MEEGLLLDETGVRPAKAGKALRVGRRENGFARGQGLLRGQGAELRSALPFQGHARGRHWASQVR
jgi:hypothetical protein